MTLAFHELTLLFRTHPAWRLLRADHGPFIMSFLDKVFVEPNVRLMSQSDLESKLEDTLYFLRENDADISYSRSAREYLDDWAHNEKGFLRKFYLSSSDEPHFDLTPGTEKALTWIKSLTSYTFVGTESKLHTLFELLKEMVIGAETDATKRIEELEKQKSEIDLQIIAIRNGDIPVLDETALRERFMQFSTMARELLSDFRAVEHNFRQLDMRVREKIATWDGKKGELLEDIFGERDVIIDSDQGRSFRAFWDFLMSSSSQEEFSDLLEQVFLMNALSRHTDDKRLKRIHFDWLEAGEHTQRTVASLSQQLRRYLDNQAFLENRRIMQILDSIAHSALVVKNSTPQGNFMSIDESSPDISIPMDRPLYTPAIQVYLNSLIDTADQEDIDLQALFNQVFINKAELKQNIQKCLQTVDQISLGTLVSAYPLSRGLAELVTYLVIAGSDKMAVINESDIETIAWMDTRGTTRRASIPKIIFSRIQHD